MHRRGVDPAGESRIIHLPPWRRQARRPRRQVRRHSRRGWTSACDAMHVRSLYTDLAQGGAARTGRLCVASARAEGPGICIMSDDCPKLAKALTPYSSVYSCTNKAKVMCQVAPSRATKDPGCHNLVGLGCDLARVPLSRATLQCAKSH